MKSRRPINVNATATRRLFACVSPAALLFLTLASPALIVYAADGGDAPVVDQSKTSQALKDLPRKPLSERASVTVHDFRSSSSAVTTVAATDMFTTALIDSGQFRVMEPQKTAGTAGSAGVPQPVRGARYIFEGTVTEANVAETQKQGGVNFAGLNLGGGAGKGSIAVDLRVLDADTGEVLDTFAIRKSVKSSGVSVGGTAGFANSMASLMGRSISPMTPDVNVQAAQKEGVDKAMHACIDAAVLQLIKRLPAATAATAGT